MQAQRMDLEKKKKIPAGQAHIKDACHQQEDPKSAYVTGTRHLVLTNLA